MTNLVFLDTETTGTDSDRHEIWEIATITRTGDGDAENGWRIRPDLTTADPTALRIGRYYERMESLAGAVVGAAYQFRWADSFKATDDQRTQTSVDVAARLAPMLDGATLVGAVVDFDSRFLTRFLRRNGHAGCWRYRLLDIEAYAAGALCLPESPGLDDLLAAYGLAYDEADRHTGLGDARMVRDLYDAVRGGHGLEDALREIVTAKRDKRPIDFAGKRIPGLVSEVLLDELTPWDEEAWRRA